MSDAAMIVAGAVACLGLAGAGSAFGTGFAAAAAVGFPDKDTVTHDSDSFCFDE